MFLQSSYDESYKKNVIKNNLNVSIYLNCVPEDSEFILIYWWKQIFGDLSETSDYFKT